MAKILLFVIALCLSAPVNAQDNSDDSDLGFIESSRNIPVQTTQKTPFEAVKKKDSSEFVIAPIPFLNPSQGWGLALAAQYIFTIDGDESPPSIIAGGAFYTEKHSYGGALGYLGKLRNDRWRIGLGVGSADIFYDFYGVGEQAGKNDVSIPIKQTAKFAGLLLMTQIYDKFFAGLELVGVDLTTSINPDHPEYISQNANLEVKNNFVTPNLKFQWDKRDNSFYPTQGHLSDVTMTFHSESFNDNNTYQAYKFAWNQYLQLATFDVLALRFMTRQTFGDVPFYDLSQFGQQGDLRGYESGKYRDKMMWAAQMEWRHRLTDRWGCVVFAGAGEVAPDLKDFSDADLLSSGGAGLRFKIASKNPVDFRFDTAYGDERVSYYFSVGQAY